MDIAVSSMRTRAVDATCERIDDLAYEHGYGPLFNCCYFVGAEAAGLFKIGFASDLGKRLIGLRAGSPVELELLFTVAGGRKTETQMHSFFAQHRRHSEWFELNSETRWAIAKLRAAAHGEMGE